MARNKMTIDFQGFNELYEKLDRLNADTKRITEKALEESFNIVIPGIQSAIAPHRHLGFTENSLVTSPNLKWEGNKVSVDIGFDISNGGIASIFLMYGTPRHMVKNKYGSTGKTAEGVRQDMNLYNSIYGTSTQNKVKKAQQKVFEDALREAMG